MPIRTVIDPIGKGLADKADVALQDNQVDDINEEGANNRDHHKCLW